MIIELLPEPLLKDQIISRQPLLLPIIFTNTTIVIDVVLENGNTKPKHVSHPFATRRSIYFS
jgi:hypothetical protein